MLPKPFQVGITFATITPESAEAGDFEETGWFQEYEPAGVRDIIDLLRRKGLYDYSSSSGSIADGWTWIILYPAEDYITGEVTEYNLHVKGVKHQLERLQRIIDKKFNVRRR